MMKIIKCPECGGKIEDGNAKMVYEISNAKVSIKNVPAKVCRKCKNELIDPHTAKDVDLLVNRVAEDFERFAKSLALPVNKVHNISLAV